MKPFKIAPAHPTDQHHNVTDGNFVIHCHYEDEAQSVLRAVNNHAKLLEALEETATERHKDAYPINNLHALAFEDCRESRCAQARAVIEETRK